MPVGIFRVRPGSGEDRLAVGTVDDGPRSLLPPRFTLDAVLSPRGPSVDEVVRTDGEDLPGGISILAPVASQEIWAAGVTYLRSREARAEEAIEASPYDRVFEAERPELFFKGSGWRARGPMDPIGIRDDSDWDVPEPEITLILDAELRIVGYTLGNDVSSRSIEGENTLYLSQAKVYDGSCAIGPAIVPATEVDPPFDISMRIQRDGEVVYEGSTSTDRMARTFEELASYLGRALQFPVGALLMTGTGLVPETGFTLAEGDVVAITSGDLGVLENRVQRIGASPRGGVERNAAVLVEPD